MHQPVARHADAVGALQVEDDPLGLRSGQSLIQPQQRRTEPVLE